MKAGTLRDRSAPNTARSTWSPRPDTKTARGGRSAYDSRTAAEAKKNDYETQGFETQLVEEEGALLLYTRRVVKEIVVEGAPPSV